MNLWKGFTTDIMIYVMIIVIIIITCQYHVIAPNITYGENNNIYWYILLHVYLTYKTDRYIYTYIRRDRDWEIKRKRNIKVRINKKVFIEKQYGYKELSSIS